TAARQELTIHLVEHLYVDEMGQPSKWWMAFQKRRFVNCYPPGTDNLFGRTPVR
ncbi:uncharacterized protein F5891DRAFT_949750, partial [Suillus fuscotomentosus]